MLEGLFIRFMAAAILAGLAGWILVLFPFGAVGLREAPAVRVSAAIVRLVVFALALLLIQV